MKRKRHVFVLLWAVAVVACGGPPKTRIERLYEGLADPLPRIDPAVLAGRRILIDPGHGGHFRGTVGQDSLEESHVNLGVSLYLWGLLTEAGAEVTLTRAIDRDFLSAADSTLRSDLQTRVDMADTLAPDVLISIHHNAQAARDPSVNTVETYYKAGDPASLDLAFAIHRHLMRNLGIDTGEVRQGNYYILRNVDMPAVLGESSYLTHPPVEEKLKLSKTQKLEAEAYFLGLLDYFSRGIPKITPLSPLDSLQGTPPLIAYAFTDDGGEGIDPDGIHMTINGRAVTPALADNGRRFFYRLPWDAPNGTYDVVVSARNVLGNTSAPERTAFAIDLPPDVAVFAPKPESFTPGGVVRVRARLLDRRGMPVAEGTPVSVITPSAGDGFEISVTDGVVEFPAPAPDAGEALRITLECRGKRFETTIPRAEGDGVDLRPVHVVDAGTGAPLELATVALRDSLLQSGSNTGVYFLPGAGAPAGAIRISAPGFIPADSIPADADTVRMHPWFDGVLLGKRFVIDPEGGRPRDIGMGQLGLAAGHVNLQVAKYLSGFLRAAGCDVLLTRTTEEVRTPEDIARVTNRYGADRYVEIRHRAEPADSALAARVYHFPGSANGSRMAADVLASMNRRLGHPARGPWDQVTYPLQQTACPAIVVEAPSIADVNEELRLTESRYLREQAYAVFLGILDHFGAPDSTALVVRVEAPETDRTNWLVVVDGTWPLLTGPDGTATFEALPPGPHTVSWRKGTRHGHTRVELPAGTARLERRISPR